jgi:hypothetical protein
MSRSGPKPENNNDVQLFMTSQDEHFLSGLKLNQLISGSPNLKVHKHENFLASDFEFSTFYS